MDEGSTKEYISIVSMEFRTVKDLKSIRQIFVMLTPEMWVDIDELAKTRIEHMVLKSLESGEYIVEYDNVLHDGWFATWFNRFLAYASHKELFRQSITHKLAKEDTERAYIFQFFMHALPQLYDEIVEYRVTLCAASICEALNTDNPEYSIFFADKFRKNWYRFSETWHNIFQEKAEAGSAAFDLIAELTEDIPF
jgi:hypothetical protein